MKNKKVLVIGSIVIILVCVAAVIYLLVTSNDKPQNTGIEGINLAENKEILEDKTINNFKITNVSLLTRDGISSYKAWVVNESNTDVKINKLYVIFQENETETKLLALNNATINANGKTYITVTSDRDLTKTTKIEYILED